MHRRSDREQVGKDVGTRANTRRPSIVVTNDVIKLITSFEMTDSRASLRSPVRLALVATLFGLFALSASAAQTIKTSSGSNKFSLPEPVGESSALSIEITASQHEPQVGSGFGLSADVTNISKATVFLDSRACGLAVPPELLPAQQSGDMKPVGLGCWFPTFYASPAHLAIPPRGTYTIVFRPYESGKREPVGPFRNVLINIWRDVKDELGFMLFNPGDYRVTMLLHYWAKKPPKAYFTGVESVDPPPKDYAIATKSAVVPVRAPEAVVLLGAAVGALLAFLIFPPSVKNLTGRGTSAQAAWWVTVRAAGGLVAMAIGVMATILASRLSESHFIVRVTVQDIWGALAVGFAAEYGGTALLQTMIGRRSRTDSAPARRNVDRPRQEGDANVF